MNFADDGPTTGIVWAYGFKRGGAAQPIAIDRVDAALAEHGEGWIWVHLALADNRCRTWINERASLSEIAREVLTGADAHLRLDIVGDEIVGVLPDLHQELSERSDELVRLRFVMTERMLITARQRPAYSVENNRRALESGKRFPTALSFLDAIIDEFADAIGQLADRMGDDLDLIEDRVLHEQPSDDRARLGRIRLQLVRVHRQLAQLKAIFNRLDSRLSAQNKQTAQAIRALAQKLDSIDHEIESLHQRARLLLDEMAARMAETTNRQLFTLSVLTACLLPPTLVTGIFGMNTKDLPFQNTGGGTYWAMLFAALAGACCFWALRRLRAF